MKRPIKTVADLDDIRFVDGLVPVVAQDEATGQVLMLAWANRDALKQSLETGRMTYWSRGRAALWAKGDTSGHTQQVVQLSLDCDGDALLATVRQVGPACHEGTPTCWDNQDHSAGWLGQLGRLAQARQAAPEGRYTDQLLADAKLVAAKIVEEANEVATVLRGEDNDDSLEHEAADLLFHLTIALQAQGVDIADVLRHLQARH